MSWAWKEVSIVFASWIEFSSCACPPDCCRAAPAACWNFAMTGWLSEFLEQELNPVGVFLDIDADENSDDLFSDDFFPNDSDYSWDIPETRADSDAAPMALTDSETEWASDNASAFRPATPSCPDSDDEAPSRQPPATHDDKDEAPSRQPLATHDDEGEARAKRFCAAIPTRHVKDKTTPITGLSAAEMRTGE